MTESTFQTRSKATSPPSRFPVSGAMVLTGVCLVVATIATGLDGLWVQRWERQVQTRFLELRGPRRAPENIVILAIDEESLAQAEYYQSDPDAYADLAPIEQWPWQRQAYSLAIDRILAAGAKAVAVDVVFSTESGYGSADDDAFTQVLNRYGDRVVLAGFYQNTQLRQGDLLKPTLPIAKFQQTGSQIGIINFPIEPDGRIHRQGHTYRNILGDTQEALAPSDPVDSAQPPFQSFAQATLQAAEIPYSPQGGTDINFLGPAYTFQRVPFWYVLDADPWQRQLASGEFFKDKIVLIGSTARLHQDFHAAPFSKTFAYPEALPGVEILANDIATLQGGTALFPGLPHPWLRAGFILLLGSGFATLIRTRKRTLYRLSWTGGSLLGWLGISFVVFLLGRMLLPTAMGAGVIAAIGSSHIGVGIAAERLRKQRLRNTLAQYVTSPIVQEIISQEEDFQDLLQARQAEVIGMVLGGRYQVMRLLGSGGFGETYVAQDTQRPHQPDCVVKQLKIISDDPKAHHLARRLFVAEAETLERLGHHDQIPRLLAHFEAHAAFYLVEEMIEGRVLKDELGRGSPKSQAWVVNFLMDLLPVIEFVHSQGVIHRDIKPSNIICRKQDGRCVLIDFGSVKQISNQLTDTEAQVTSTIGIGTKGYMPSEQSAGLPRFNSDLYALGVTAIEALTGTSPYKMTYDDRGELIWQYQVPNLNPDLAHVLSNLIRYDFSQRYPSATIALNALKQISVRSLPQDAPEQSPPAMTSEDDGEQPTGFLPDDWMTREDLVTHYSSDTGSDTAQEG